MSKKGRSFKRIALNAPSVHKFKLPLNASTADPQWFDIHTKLRDGYGWHILGFRAQFERLDLTNPVVPYHAALVAHQFQIHRNLDNVAMLSSVDDDCILNKLFIGGYVVEGGMGPTDCDFEHWCDPDERLTVQRQLRFIYESYPDATQVSDANHVLAVRLFYRKIRAPKDGRTQFGPLDEI